MDGWIDGWMDENIKLGRNEWKKVKKKKREKKER